MRLGDGNGKDYNGNGFWTNSEPGALWSPLSPDWSRAMKMDIEQCTGLLPNLQSFKRSSSNRITTIISPDGKIVYVFSGLQIHDPNHRGLRDSEAQCYPGFNITPFESPLGNFSGFVGRSI
jgi:hypothetical protein